MSNTPRTSRLIASIEEREGEPVDWHTAPEEWVDLARELERENARLREALEVAEKELVHLFTVLPIGGVLPSPSVMQHIQWARFPNSNKEVPSEAP